MFVRVKKSGRNDYLQIVENKRVQDKVKQRVIATIGRLDELQAKGRVESLIRSLNRFSEKTLLILSGQTNLTANAVSIGPAIIFDRLWKELRLPEIIHRMLAGRKFEFDVERSIFLTVLHRLFESGSDRCCDRWRHGYAIAGVNEIALHHIYRAMSFLGEELEDQTGVKRFVKDIIEEDMFSLHRNLFTGLDIVFFDTTSIYFEGEGGETLGQYGHSKDHRPDRKQMVVGVILDDGGRPICCEMWPGNTADVKILLPVVKRLQNRFSIQRFCIVADRGMISNDTIKALEHHDYNIPYILGARMRQVKEVNIDVLSRAGRYREVYPEGTCSKDPSPLEVKEVFVEGRRYIVCRNPRQAKRDALVREAMLKELEEQIRKNPKGLIGNRGYARYLRVSKGGMTINREKINEESRFDGKWVLRTNMTDFSAEQVALKYKELWQVERTFRDVKSVIETRPIFHKCDETIRGHVFCSFLALILRKELENRLERVGHQFEWDDIRRDLMSLQEVTVEENGHRLGIRTSCVGVCSKIFQAVGIAIPPTIRDV